MKKHMKKSWLYLISTAIFIFISCNSNFEKINIEWTVICDISDIDFRKTPIELEFTNIIDDKLFRLIPNKTKNIKIQKDMYLFGRGWQGAFKIFFFPIDIPGIKIEDYGAIEIFIYQPPVEETENSVTFMPDKQVLAYYYCLFNDNKIYRVFSKGNHLNLDFNTMKEIDADDDISLEKIVEIIGENYTDTFYYLETKTTKKLFYFYYYDYNPAGYIVKSKLKNSLHVLD
jgi:hypothetical protein